MGGKIYDSGKAVASCTKIITQTAAQLSTARHQL